MMDKIAFCHIFVKTTLPNINLKLTIMRYVNTLSKKSTKKTVDLIEFTNVYRSVHQLVAMRTRNHKENELFHAHLKRAAELLYHINPDIDPKISKMINFSFQYYKIKQEEALDGDKKAQRIVRELQPLFHKGLLSLVYKN